MVMTYSGEESVLDGGSIFLSNLSTIELESSRDRLLAWDGCLNARDLGGYLTADGLTTRWGAIVRSDSLVALTPAGQRALHDYGVRTIVDLRLASEIEEDPNPFATPGDHDITYIHRSFIGDDPKLHDPFPTMAGAYVHGLGHNISSIGSAISAIATARDGGVLIHCHGGRDRTGLVSALLLSLVRVPDQTIADDYALSDECLRSRDDDFLENGPGERADRERELERSRTTPEVMLETLSWLEETYGDATAYLRHAGVTDEEIALIRERLIG
jgi:protein tyrosine/serine phosphatase